jgi:hypothetical protein
VGGPQSSTKMFTRWVIHNLLKKITFKIKSTFNFQKEIIKNYNDNKNRHRFDGNLFKLPAA